MLSFFYQIRKNFRDTRGVSLIITLGLTIMLMAIAVTAMNLVLGFVRTTFQVEQANIAYSAAEGGVELALYDLANYKDGYETDSTQLVCKGSVDITQTINFSDSCDGSHEYRFVNFTTDSALSGGRGFWQLFSRTLDSDPTAAEKYYLPNSYFVGDKDGNLETSEWGKLTKDKPISWSLLIDDDPAGAEPKDRFLYLSDTDEKKITILTGPGWDPNMNGNTEDELLTWTFAALNGAGNECTLQGVIWESDFTNQDCDDSGVTDADEYCFIFDLNDNAAHNPSVPDGDPYAGEDINRNLPSGNNSIGASFNRVSSVGETFRYATPQKFLTDLNSAMAEFNPNDQWVSVRLTINLIATLSETSRDTLVSENDSLQFRLESDEVWADEHTFIISEGFSGLVKQTIETRFSRGSAIPIFSYVIFQ